MDQQDSDDRIPPRPRARLRIGVTGHRFGLKFPESAAAAVRDTVNSILADIARLADQIVARDTWAFSNPTPVLSILSPLAEGSDRIVAEAGIAAGFPLSVILPFARSEYRRDFTNEESGKSFDSLLAQASCVFELDGRRDVSARSYEAAGLLMLANADIVIAIWDQMPANGIGGTAVIVENAVAEGVPVILIDPRKPAEPSILWRADVWLATARTGIEEIPRRPVSALLKDVVALLLAPPADDDERRALQAVFAEKTRRWNFAVSYPVLLFLLGVRGLRRSDVRASREDRSTRWRDYLKRQSNDAGLSSGLPESLLSAYAFIDHLSVHYAQLYRSAYVFSYSAAAGAVLMALSGLLLPAAFKPFLLIFEIVLILAILVVVGHGSRRRWHRRWLEYRRLAETLSHLRILSLTGTAARLDRPGNRATKGQGWINWYARAVERGIALPNRAVDRTYLAAVRDAVRIAELKPQIQYNRLNADAMQAVGERLHGAGTILFLATFAICSIGLVFYLVMPKMALGYENWLIFLTAILPTAGAAINAIRAQGDFQAVAERSRETADRLEELDEAMAREPLEFARLCDRIDKAAELMMSDVADWNVLTQSRPLSLPA